ncbi:Lrp/AsnC family transcriptional regulator [Roseiarcaceae bacterium H3SJ34-1]|uniref:Lrp/AsnC family transcriptional regulator n=1 Tax=Terripilifer ovatus TaxID=3032367 RepID=UPI003AB95717|nr:Lrp/AsnC family transcriptional regulator [Roseiarcaceae bacterium H3SJ34-1]
MAALDALDESIIRLLRLDARMTNARLAAEVGLSQSACLRRLRLLESSGVIRGYTVLLDEPTDSRTTVVIVQVTLERQTDEFLRRFEAAVRRCPEVCQCDLMSGLSDYVLRVETRNASDYERIHTEVLSQLPGVARIQSNFAIRTVVKSRNR